MNHIELCPTCKGSGRSTELYDAEGSHGREYVASRECICPTCDGSGRVHSKVVYRPYPNPNNKDFK